MMNGVSGTALVAGLLIVCTSYSSGAAERPGVQSASATSARAVDVGAMNRPPVPQEAAMLHVRLNPKLQPSARAWVREQARKLAAGTTTVESLRPTLQGRFGNLSGIGTGDIEALAFIVMMEATRETEEDLKKIMAEVKKLTEAKAKLRELVGSVDKDVAASAGRRGNEPCIPPKCGAYARELSAASSELGRLNPGRGGRLTAPKTVGDLKPLQDSLKNSLDGMNETSEMTSLRLQMMMDRRSKFISTLSNIMKKISTTQDTLLMNLK